MNLNSRQKSKMVTLHNEGHPLTEIARTMELPKDAVEDYLYSREGYPGHIGPIDRIAERKTASARIGRGQVRHKVRDERMFHVSEFEIRVVEVMARAMCVAAGLDPDEEVIISPDNIDWCEFGPRWRRFAGTARQQYLAHIAMMAELMRENEQKAGNPV